MPSVIASILFFIYIFTISVISGPILKKFYNLFNGLEVYHKLPRDYPDESDKGEPFAAKCYYLIKYLLILQAIGTAFGLTYLTYITGDELITIESSLALGFFMTVLVLSVRQASFAQVGEPKNPNVMNDLKEKSHAFSFSFLLTIYFLSMIGFGVGLINGLIPLTLGLPESVDLVRGFVYGALFLLFPVLMGILNEASLYFLKVPEKLMEES